MVPPQAHLRRAEGDDHGARSARDHTVARMGHGRQREHCGVAGRNARPAPESARSAADDGARHRAALHDHVRHARAEPVAAGGRRVARADRVRGGRWYRPAPRCPHTAGHFNGIVAATALLEPQPQASAWKAALVVLVAGGAQALVSALYATWRHVVREVEIAASAIDRVSAFLRSAAEGLNGGLEQATERATEQAIASLYWCPVRHRGQRSGKQPAHAAATRGLRHRPAARRRRSAGLASQQAAANGQRARRRVELAL